MYIHAMKKLFLCALVLSILFQPSFSNEKITIWGDFIFDMRRKQAINVLEKHCKKINFETEVRVSIKADGCKFSFEPFQNSEASIDLVFNFAFLKHNRRLRYIVFTFDDLDKKQLTSLYKYSYDNWFVSNSWNCNKPSIYSVSKQTIQICGGSFNNGRVRLTNTISQKKEGAGYRTNRITSMHFYAFEPKNPIVGNP